MWCSSSCAWNPFIAFRQLNFIKNCYNSVVIHGILRMLVNVVRGIDDYGILDSDHEVACASFYFLSYY